MGKEKEKKKKREEVQKGEVYIYDKYSLIGGGKKANDINK